MKEIIKEYIRLTKNIKIARRNMIDAKAGITVMQKEINLNLPKPEVKSCINQYNCVIAGNSAEFTPFVTFCDLFSMKEICANRKCPLAVKNTEYIVAQQRYENERKLRHEFVKQCLTIST